MKNKLIFTTLLLIITTTLVLSIPAVFAGNKNHNDDLGFTAGKSVERGTGKHNHQDGCAPPAQSGNFWVYMGISPAELIGINLGLASQPFPFPPPDGPLHYWQITSVEWMGGPCCPSNEYDLAESIYPLPNQCCNAPDENPTVPGVPGNHCLCFMLRGYPIPNPATSTMVLVT